MYCNFNFLMCFKIIPTTINIVDIMPLMNKMKRKKMIGYFSTMS